MSEQVVKKSRRRIVVIYIVNTLLIAALALAIIWGARTYFNLDKELFTNDAQVEEYINPVNTRISGYIKEVRFTEHTKVKKGDTLAIIDNSEYKIQLEQAEAGYLSANAARDVASSAVSTVGSNQQVTDANIKAAIARLWNAEQNFNRYENLLKDGAATQQQYDQAATEYNSLNAQLQALQQQKITTSLSTNETSKKVFVNEAEIKRAHAALEMAKLNLSYTVITAPYDGVTGRRNIQEGQLVQAGQTLLSFVRNDSKWVVANYKETQATKLREGQRMRLTVDGFADKTFIGVITAVSQATGAKYSAVPVDNSTGNFVKVQQRIPVKIEFVEKENKPEDLELLKAGMNVSVQKTD